MLEQLIRRVMADAIEVEEDGVPLFLLGDILFTSHRELRRYAYGVARHITGGSGDPLIVMTDSDDQRSIWPPGTTLTYRVDPSGMKDAPLVREALSTACADWQRVLEPAITFEEVSGSDATMVVRQKPALRSGLMATAFFPHEHPDRNKLTVYPALFTSTNYEPVGVLRHELGHVLGFRHEHIHDLAPPDKRVREPGGREPVTDYDSESVMHYPSPGVPHAFTLSDTDIEGARQLYGLPPMDIP